MREKVFQKLREDILKGKYKKGDELVECTIGKELGVSRTPVREAVRQSLMKWRIFYERKRPESHWSADQRR